MSVEWAVVIVEFAPTHPSKSLCFTNHLNVKIILILISLRFFIFIQIAILFIKTGLIIKGEKSLVLLKIIIKLNIIKK